MPTGRSSPAGKGQFGAPDQAAIDARSVAAILIKATDATADAWVACEAIRDQAGRLVDVRLLYGNAAFWELTGFDPATSVGRAISDLAPGVDWTQGIAARLFTALKLEQTYSDRRVVTRPQVGPHRGHERTFELEIATEGNLAAVGFRDITDAERDRERTIREARRSASLARFLATAVDPATDRATIFQALATELAGTIGDVASIARFSDEGGVSLAGIAGGPGDTTAYLASHLGQPLPLTDDGRAVFLVPETVILAPIPDEVRGAILASLAMLGLPDEFGAHATSLITSPVRSGGTLIGGLVLLRYGDAAPYDKDDQAAVEALSAAASLVFERRAVGDELASSLTRFEALFEQAPIAMIAVGRDRSVRFNGAAEKLTGRDRAELAANAFRPGAPWIPPDQEALWAELRRQVGTGEPIRGHRFALVRPNGERREISGDAIPIVDRTGRPDGIVAVLTDLTEREHLESQLRHAQKMEALGRLAGGIAHDFNNVLMAIQGFAELVAEDAHRGRVAPREADQVLAATNRAIDLTARLTTFARRDLARVAPVDVKAALEAILPLLRRLAPESIEIATNLRDTPGVRLDVTEFDQLVVNLVVNAVDAMPSGGRLTIETDTAEVDSSRPANHVGLGVGPHVVLAVHDTGVGMDEGTRGRIFEPFFTTKELGAGTGLGLSMVFAAVERAAGSISVDSESGRGTTFRIHLPVATEASDDNPTHPPERPTAGGSESILLIEDEPLVRQLVERVLTGLGYQVEAAAGPVDALAVAGDRTFDLVVTDIVMPGMTGDVAAAQLRDLQPGLPVVYMSGYAASSHGLELGPDELLLQKPLSPRELGRVVRAALDARSETAPPPRPASEE